MTALDPEEQRASSREAWERSAAGWANRADRIRDWGMPVSVTMVDALALQPGDRILELAAGPGDTGFMAAELIQPGGTLICSDGAEAMVAVARERAQTTGVTNVEFRQLELEWIDMDTASVDAVLCRWGIMLIVDPAAAAGEIRRVLRPGGRAAFAVWDEPERNPWATIPGRVMIELGHTQPPAAGAPGMFTLAAPGVLAELLQAAGFTDVKLQPVAVRRDYARVSDFVHETVEMSPMFSAVFTQLGPVQQAEAAERMTAAAGEFTAADGSVQLPGSALVAVATA